MTTPYSDSVSAKADGSGRAVFNFRPAQARHVVQCAATVDGAASSAVSKATVGIAGGVGRPWGRWTGANASQGLQFIAPEILSLVTTGLTAGTDYTAFLEGVDYDTEVDFVPYMSPSQPYSTTVAGGSLKFQHNAADVATEPVIDFEDGGVTWTLTDDPAGSRVKVTGALGTQDVALSGDVLMAAGADVLIASAVFGAAGQFLVIGLADIQNTSGVSNQGSIGLQATAGTSTGLDFWLPVGARDSRAITRLMTSNAAGDVVQLRGTFAGTATARQVSLNYPGNNGTRIEITRIA